jgi:Zn finger protein HypA/HybF involved in hydrogenase expression
MEIKKCENCGQSYIDPESDYYCPDCQNELFEDSYDDYEDDSETIWFDEE